MENMEEMENMKKKDTAAIIAFLKGKGVVPVARIMAESGAETLRVYPILLELKFAGRLQVHEETERGAPATVSLIEE